MKSGIYQIKNLITGKVYVGSALNLRQRWAEHQSTANRGIHRNRKLQAAWNKYGRDAFEFSILLYCEPHNLILYEQIVIDALDVIKLGYNLSPKAGSSLGVKLTDSARAKISEVKRGFKHTEETKAKMSVAQKGNKYALGWKHTDETKAKLSTQRIGNKINLGRKQTPEHIAKVAAKNTGRKRAPTSDETRKKISVANSGRKQTPEQIAKRFSPEAKAKMAAAAKTRSTTPEGRAEQARRAHLQNKARKADPNQLTIDLP